MGREGFLGEFEQMLLLAAMRLEDEAYGMRLMEELEISVGRKVSRGSVYVTLDRLEDKGWIVSEHSASRPERGGRPRRILRDLDPDLSVIEAKTMNEHLALILFPPRMAAVLLSVFGSLALTLAAIGIYGVVSHAVSRRTRELGIRMSLGATARGVVRMAISGGMRLVLIGATVGMVLAGTVTWTISGFLFGVQPNDVATFIAIPALLSVVALFAAWIPASRASRIDPAQALRREYPQPMATTSDHHTTEPHPLNALEKMHYPR
jgi:hypothetical protein